MHCGGIGTIGFGEVELQRRCAWVSLTRLSLKISDVRCCRWEKLREMYWSSVDSTSTLKMKTTRCCDGEGLNDSAYHVYFETAAQGLLVSAELSIG